MANKNVTGGIILLISGSALVSLVASKKGQQILAILTEGGGFERGGGFSSATPTTPSQSQSTPSRGNGFSDTRGGGFTKPAAPVSAPVSATNPDYKSMFGFSGERGAAVI